MALYVTADHEWTYEDGLPTSPLCVFSESPTPQEVVDIANRSCAARYPNYKSPYLLDQESSRCDSDRWRIENQYSQIENDWRFLSGCRLYRDNQDFETRSWDKFVLLVFRASTDVIKLLIANTGGYSYDGELRPRIRGSEEDLARGVQVETHSTLTVEKLQEIAKTAAMGISDVLLDLIPALLLDL